MRRVLASYDHPTGILGELVSQMADAFWWVKIYRAEKNHLVVSEMADRVITKLRQRLQKLGLSCTRGCRVKSLTRMNKIT